MPLEEGEEIDIGTCRTILVEKIPEQDPSQIDGNG